MAENYLNSSAVQELYESFMASTTLEELYYDKLLPAYENSSELLAEFTNEQIIAIGQLANTIFAAVEDPDASVIYQGEDLYITVADLHEELMAALATVFGEYNWSVYDVNLNSTLTISSAVEDGDASLTGNRTWTFNEGGILTLKGKVTIPSGKTLTIKGVGTIKRGGSNNKILFDIQAGGTLVIEGTTIGSIVIDGIEKNTANAAIVCDGKLTLKKVTLQGNYIYKNETESNRSGAGIRITSKATNVTLEDTLITDCMAVDASAIFLKSSGSAVVKMTRCVVENCQAINPDKLDEVYGGAIRTNGNGKYQMTMTDCIVRNNYSFCFGGGVYWNANANGALLTVTDCQFLENTAEQRGGGIFIEGNNIVFTASAGTVSEPVKSGMPGELTGTLIQGNEAGGEGGGFCYKCYSNDTAVFVSKTDIELTNNVLFKDNIANNGAGLALCLDATSNYNNGAVFNVTIDGATLTNNNATADGGAIYVSKNRDDYVLNTYFKSGLVENNTAANGGAVYVTKASNVATGGSFEISGGTLQNNYASENGGAVYVTSGNFTQSGGEIKNNGSKNGDVTSNGGAVYVSGGNYTMSAGTIESNIASENGGAVYVSGGNFKMIEGAVNENEAINGGAVYVTGGDFEMTDGTMTENDAVSGGAVYVTGGNFEMTNGEINNNSASGNGGAVYLTDGTFEMFGGSISSNSANNNGGAAYIASGNISVLSGNITSNACTYNGGAFYIADGNVSIGVEGCLYEDGNDYHTVSGYTEMMHPVIQYNNANRGGSIYLSSANGIVYHHCGTMIDNYTYDTGRNLYLENGTFNYYAGQIGTNFDTGIEIENGVFNDLSGSAQEKIIKELIYHSSLVPYTEDDEIRVNAGIPETKWINAPNAVNLLLEDVDPDSPTWGELFPEYTFVSWYSEENDQSIDLYADWVGSSMNLFKIQQGEQGQSGVLLPSGGLML